MLSRNGLILWGVLCAACTGNISGDAAPGGDADLDGIPDGQDPDPTGPQSTTDVHESLGAATPLPDGVGLRPLERLSREELQYSLQDLFGMPVVAELPEDGLGPSGFELPGVVSEVEGRGLQATAEAVAARVVTNLPGLMGCDASVDENGCVSQFISGFGRRAFRRPLDAGETQRLRTLFDAARVDHDLAGSATLVIRAVLQSPQFLYHFEHDSQPALSSAGIIDLTPYEVASRLSYLLWVSLPDTQLLDAAASGALSSAQGLTAEFDRMLQDPRVERSLGSFHVQWLSLQQLPQAQKDPELYPSFDPALASSMLEATRHYVSEVVLRGDGLLDTLLTSPRVYVNESLALIYGVTGVLGKTLVARDLDPAQRAGLLTQAAFLSAHATANGSNPILRGKVVYERVACGVTAAPPPNVPPPAPPTPGLTTRQRFAQHAENACAKACHEKFDPPGFAFENYDAVGQFRSVENGQPIDAHGTLDLPLDGPVSFQSAVELSRALASSSDARECLVRQWSRFALKRHETAGELGSLQSTFSAFRASGFNVRELLRNLVVMKTFLKRLPAEGEVLR